MIDRSADAVTAVTAVEVLFARTGSNVADDTDAVLVRVATWPGAVTVTVTTGAAVPVARPAVVQVTETLPTFVQVQPVPVADTSTTPTGRVSVTARPVASEGPRLSTASWYVTAPPATTVAGPVLAIARSADAVTAVSAVEVLFAGSGSAVVAVTDAVFDRVAACAGAVTTTVIVGAVTPVASAGLVQLTETLPTLVHVQPAPVADTKVIPTGSESETVSAVESDGPLFTTTSE